MLRFGYDGAGFWGWAAQPGKRTVEGELLRALGAHRQFRSEVPRTIPVASRTDRGVSARGNALVLESRLGGPAVLRVCNGLVPEIYFTHAVEAEEGFLPRHATGRTYRYLEPAEGHDLRRWQELAGDFVGTFDVRSFGRGLPTNRPALRSLTRFDVNRVGDWLVVELEGRSFVWGMVRKLVAALRAAEAGRISDRQLDAARRGESRVAIPLAEPEGLILWEVHYARPWGPATASLHRSQQRFWASRRREAALRSAVLGHLAPVPG